MLPKQCDVTSGDWHFYALVVSSNGAGDVGFESVQFYQNGEFLSEICSLGPYSTTINTGSSSPMTIGAYFNASIRFFDGSLDDLGVWDRAQIDAAGIWSRVLSTKKSLLPIRNNGAQMKQLATYNVERHS